VGYIIKEAALDRGPHWAVQGTTRLYSFEDAYPLDKIVEHSRNVRVEKLSARQTARILDHFVGKKNILDECLRELRRLAQDHPGNN
jgi:hypothetical protein